MKEKKKNRKCNIRNQAWRQQNGENINENARKNDVISATARNGEK
jgi:hypothetical protein